MLLQPRPGLLGQEFGLRTRDKDGAADFQFQAAEGCGAQNMLEGFALAAALNRGPDAVKGGRVNWAVELEVELESGDLEGVGQDPFDLESGGLDSAGLEERGATLDHLKDTHVGQLSLAGSARQT